MPQAQIVNDRRPIELRHPQGIRHQLRRIRRDTLPVAHFAHGATRTPQSPCDLAQAAALGQSSSDLLVPMHRHAPKRHAAVSFVVTHEGCSRQSLNEGSEARKHGLDRGRRKIGGVRGPRAAIASHPWSQVPLKPPQIWRISTSADHSHAPAQRPKRRRWWSPTEEIGWSRTQEIRWYPTEEIGWVRSEEILHDADKKRGRLSRPDGKTD